MTKITVLGSGNAFNTDGKGSAAFLLETEKSKLLVDCGPTLLVKAESFKVDLQNLDAVYITHLHGDHAMGLPFLLIYMKYIERRDKPFTIIGPKGIKEWSNYALELCYPELSFPFEVFYEEMLPGRKNSSFFTNVEAMKILHKEESIGYRFVIDNYTVVFSGDSKWSSHLKDLCQNSDLAFVECSVLNKIEAAHISMEELQEEENNYLSGAKKVVLVHGYKAIEDALKETNLAYEYAKDGMVYSLKKSI